MLIESGVSAQVAEDVRISLQGQIAPKASKNDSALGVEDRQAYITLKDTWEVQDLRKAIKRSFTSRPPETLRHLTEYFGIELETFLENLTPGKAVQFVPVTGLPIKLSSGLYGCICGILALSKLRDALPRIQASTEEQQTMEGHEQLKYLDSEELSPGQVMFYDGDKPLIWKGAEEGLAFFLSIPKSKPKSNSPSGTPAG